MLIRRPFAGDLNDLQGFRRERYAVLTARLGALRRKGPDLALDFTEGSALLGASHSVASGAGHDEPLVLPYRLFG